MSQGNWTTYELSNRLPYGPHSRLMAKYVARHKRKEGIEFNQEWTPEGSSRVCPDRWRWVEHPDQGLRYVGKAHVIRGSGEGNLPYFDRALIDHTGWFTNQFQDETVCGEVYQLPARNGESLYVPAIENANGNDGAILDFHSVTSDLIEAIRTADSMAERYAESEREYQAKDAAEMQIEELKEEIVSTRDSIRKLMAELKETRSIAPRGEICKTLRGVIASRRAEIVKAKQRIEKLKENYWEAVEGY